MRSTLDTTGTAESDQSAIAVSFEAQSGDALVTYGMNGEPDVYYRIWDGASWERTGQRGGAPAVVTGDAAWLSTASDYNSDRIALAYHDRQARPGSRSGTAPLGDRAALAENRPTGNRLSQPRGCLRKHDRRGAGRPTARAARPIFKYRTWDAGGGWSGEADRAGPRCRTQQHDARQRSDQRPHHAVGAGCRQRPALRAAGTAVPGVRTTNSRPTPARSRTSRSCSSTTRTACWSNPNDGAGQHGAGDAEHRDRYRRWCSARRTAT